MTVRNTLRSSTPLTPSPSSTTKRATASNTPVTATSGTVPSNRTAAQPAAQKPAPSGLVGNHIDTTA